MRPRLMLFAVPALFGQTAAPAFEVASVKLDALPPGSFHFSGSNAAVPAARLSGNRISVNLTLAGLVAAAYNTKGYQVRGAPRWSDSRGGEEFYSIDARTAGDATPDIGYVRLCLQTLLADRFQLKVHRESAQLPVYELVVGKNGPKLKDTAGDGEAQEAGLPGGVFRFRAFNRSMADVANFLMGAVDRPVLDRTGLTGRYDYTLEFTRGNPDTAADGPGDRSIFAAVEKQLGLKLVPAAGPIEILVIDRAERPSAN